MERREFIKLGGTTAAFAALGPLGLVVPGDEADARTAQLRARFAATKKIGAAEYDSRVERLRREMRAAKLDALLLEPGTDMRYLSGLNFWVSERLIAMIVPANADPFIVCPSFEEERLKLEGAKQKIYAWQEWENPYDFVKNGLREAQISTGRIAVGPTTRYFVYAGLAESVQNLQTVSGTALCNHLRMIKSPRELEMMQLAMDITEQAITLTHAQLQPGLTERQVGKMLQENFQKMGISGGGLIQFGPNAAIPHGGTSERPLHEGDIVLMDCGGRVYDYNSDITRTTTLGQPVEKMRRVWDIVHQAQDAAIKLAKPGVQCQQLDAAARQVIDEAGFGKYFTHRLGHGLGMQGHEDPYLVKGSTTVLEPGMTMTIEPGIYLPGEFGVRIEDDIVITEDGCRVMSQRPARLTPLKT